MLDWKVTEEDAPFPPDTREETPPRRPTWRTWGMVVFVVVVLVSTTGYYLYQRVEKSEAVMRQDLFAFIQEEERARQAGLSERAPFYWFPQTQQGWQAAYEATFRTPTVAQGVTVTLESVAMQDNTAYVDVALGAQQQRRAYQLTPGGWRRTSLWGYAWGETDTIGGPTTTTSVTYHASDAAFARQLYDDLDALNPFIALAFSSYAPLTVIRIDPAELQGALLQTPGGSGFTSIAPSADTPPLEPDYRVASTEIVLNSPQVVEVPPYWGISGESAVRYAYAEWALQRMMARARIVQAMPNYGRFVEATKHTLALRWALTAEEYAAVLHKWRTRGTENGWESPFSPLAVMDARMDPFDPTPMEARMLAAAQEVYFLIGEERLAMIVAASPPAARGWDDFFLQNSQRRTVDIEAQVRGEPPTTPIPALPISGRLVRPTDLSSQQGGIAIQPDGSDSAIALTGLTRAALTLTAPGTPSVRLDASCLYLFPQATINGEWRDEGIRLAVTDMSVTEPFPNFQFQSAPPPPDAVALVGQNAQGNALTNQFETIAALSADGTITPVLTDTTGRLQVYSGSASSQRSGVMLIQGGGGRLPCRAGKMTRYTPEEGIVGQWAVTWHTEGSFPIWFWDSLTNQGLLTLASEDPSARVPFWRLSPGNREVLTVATADGTLPPGMPRLLRPGAQEVVMQQANAYALIALDSNTVTRTFTLGTNRLASEMAFSADGSTLAMIALYPGQNSLAPLLWAYDVYTSAPPTVIWEPRQGPLYNLQVDFRDPYVYMVTADTTSTQVSVRGDATQTVFTDTPGQHLLYHLACRNGGIAVLTSNSDANDVDPTNDPRTLSLFRRDGSLHSLPIPLASTVMPILC